MCLDRRFLVICLIGFAGFQFYQIYSSINLVFIQNHQNDNYNIKLLTGFHAVGLLTSSILLIVGSLKSKPNLLVGALGFLFYKVGFIVWHAKNFYDITFACRDSQQTPCDPNRLSIIYVHFLVSGKYSVQYLFNDCLTFWYCSTFDTDNCPNHRIDRRY